ncbi:MAG: PD-(D/E)XK nuclease family protein [Oscillospiraceae bacterium]
MLQLVLGIAGTGKTTHILQQMKRRAEEGLPSIFLVPEQFSSSAEMLVYQTLGDAQSALVQVASFRTLAERMLKAGGGLQVPVLTDAARAVFVRRAMDALGPEVHTFARQRRNTAFCAMCADTLSELKTAGATPAVLREVGRQANEPKLAELALIFEAYETALQNTALDPQDRLTLAAQTGGEYFAGQHCYIDNFDGFTAPEYTMLAHMLRHCEALTLALCCDGLAETSGGLGLFSPVRRTAARLLNMADKAGVKKMAPLTLQTPRRCGQGGPAAVNLLLAYEDLPEEKGLPGLTLTPCADEWEETRLAAAEMHRLAQSGVSYSRMALVCRDIAQYETSVRRAFSLFDIPYFVDAPSTIEYTAPVAFLRAALRLLKEGLSSAAILALLKTGLCGYTEEQLSALENYVYTWAPAAPEWRAPFEKNPGGLLAKQDKAALHQLALAEALRAAVVPVLEGFIKESRGQTAAALSRGLYLLLQAVKAPQHADAVVARFEQNGEPAYAEKSRRAWDVAMSLLDQMVLLVGQEKISPAEYDDLFLLLVRSTDFGQTPQVLECAVFTGADRMRLADPDYCFVVGLSEGDFPMQVGYSGLLTHTDRDLLVAGGIEMPGSFENRTLLEEMFFYRALTAPRKGLYLSWPARHGGAQKAMASALQPILLALAPLPLALPLGETAATPAAAFDLLAGAYRENTPEAASLYAALQTRPGAPMQSALRLLDEVDNSGECTVANTQAIEALVGREMLLSATRAERYYECRFSYFMERVLGVAPRRKGEFSSLESGTFIHYVLEQVLTEAKENFAALADDELRQLANRHADAFIAQNLPAATQRAAHVLARVKASTVRLLCFMRDAAAQSSFQVDALELPIGEVPGGIAPLRVETPDGHAVQVIGKIDRVDVLHREGRSYLSIIDYKTGGKKFSLEDVYCGLNLQMLIYMHTLLQNGGQRYPNPVPAAVLYLMGDPAPTTGSRQQSGSPVYKMDGLLLQDEAVARAMDNQGQGFFIPVKYNKNGSLRAGRQLASLEKIGNMRAHVEKLLAEMAEGVYGGQFPARPLVKQTGRPCDFCPYRAACRHEDGRNETMVQAPERVFEQPERGEGQ